MQPVTAFPFLSCVTQLCSFPYDFVMSDGLTLGRGEEEGKSLPGSSQADPII